MTERVLDEAMRYGSRRAYDEQRPRQVRPRPEDRLAEPVPAPDRRDANDRDRAGSASAAGISTTCASATPGSSSGSLPSECPPYLLEPLRDAPGRSSSGRGSTGSSPTRDPTASTRMRALEAMSDSIAEHLAMVFHRFLAGETVGGDASRSSSTASRSSHGIRSHGPNARPRQLADAATRHRARRHDCTRVVFDRTSFPARCSSRAPRRMPRQPGPKKWNRQQGFYIYRGDRMIQSGGWNRLRTMDEHSKLARIAIDVPPGLEELFQINVAKMRVVLPDEVRPQLRALAAGVVTSPRRHTGTGSASSLWTRTPLMGTRTVTGTRSARRWRPMASDHRSTCA